MGFRHIGKANVFFFDGHVKSHFQKDIDSVKNFYYDK
jgi:prepilin-type processing-associated H-X9-DG protein